MRVLSLFDGIACGREALKRCDVSVAKYYSSEINKSAITVASKNHDDIDHVGDVVNVANMLGVFPSILGEIDLLLGGSPCQGFSVAGNMLNFDDPRSKLFFDFVKIKNILKPKYFLLENVVMKKEWIDIISDLLGVKPIRIDSSLVSAQSRNRLYWTNIPGVEQPDDKDITLDSVIDRGLPGVRKLGTANTSVKSGTLIVPEATKKGYVEVKPFECVDVSFITSKTRRGRKLNGKAHCLLSKTPEQGMWDGHKWRTFTPIECERLQTLPDDYTAGVSNAQRYKLIGNGWTVSVIEHILKFMV